MVDVEGLAETAVVDAALFTVCGTALDVACGVVRIAAVNRCDELVPIGKPVVMN
jgi:hypothetical protein